MTDWDFWKVKDAAGRLRHKLTSSINPRFIGKEEPAEEVNAESVNTDGMEVGAISIEDDKRTIADDDVAEIDLSSFDPIFPNEIHIFSDNSGEEVGAFVVAFNQINEMAIGNSATNQGLVQLTGTDGPDASVNYAVDSGTFYVENRAGTEITISLLLIDPS
ncbi:hypothetical protein GJ633_04070 [Halorubrum sp. CBA1125]|uniref:hypothetical protein n=1 Tax=Halorubrum sp. CBA1125 TaxID=2668072 RepID=UPI0012E7ECC9|nr:hypothetical protein [Halorubrum sp. CBA1125]MUW13928.1 hypothetical protein [Halorubrum sp. CBA1125]